MTKSNPRTTIPIDKALHERFKAVAKANRYSMKVMMEIMVEEFEKRLVVSDKDAYDIAMTNAMG